VREEEHKRATVKTIEYPRDDSYLKRMRMLVGNFENNPYEKPRSCFVGVSSNLFHPYSTLSLVILFSGYRISSRLGQFEAKHPNSCQKRVFDS